MSDQLREALEYADRNVYLAGKLGGKKSARLVIAAARRWLALVETGPDYEAAEQVLIDLAEKAFGPFPTSPDAPPLVLFGVPIRHAIEAIVDAALADYPVSTEGES